MGDSDLDLISSINNLGWVLYKLKRYEEAEVYYIEALEALRNVLPNEHPDTLWTISSLAKLYDAWGKPEEAQKYRDMLTPSFTDITSQ